MLDPNNQCIARGREWMLDRRVLELLCQMGGIEGA